MTLSLLFDPPIFRHQKSLTTSQPLYLLSIKQSHKVSYPFVQNNPYSRITSQQEREKDFKVSIKKLMQKKDKSKGKRTSKMISRGRGQEGGIGGLLVLGGALALAGFMAMFTVKKNRTTRVNKNLTLPSDVSQQSNNDLCSKNNQDATRGLPYLLEFPSRTMVENSWDRGHETSTVDNTNIIDSCELVSEKSVIVAETPRSRTTTDEGKGTLEMISSDDLKQNIVAGDNNFGFLPGLSGKKDPLEYPLPMKVTDEAKEDNDESCLNAPTDAVTDKQDNEVQGPVRENSDDGSEDTECPCSELMAEAIWPDELIETMSKLEADKRKCHSEDNSAVENEEVQLKRSIHIDSSSDCCDENETKQRSKVTWKKETYLALRMIEETVLQIRAWMVWSMLMFVMMLLLSLSLSSLKAMSFILSMFSEIQSTL